MTKNKINTGVLFICMGLISLLGGLLFGILGSVQFLFPDFLKELPFYKVRPLHVSLVVAWIFLSAIGGIYYYLPKIDQLKLYSYKLTSVHFYIFIITGLVILACYVLGIFGGREYWEFPALLSIPIFISWILFGWNYFKTVFTKAGQWPVYYWMWATGIVFFFITFAESYLWLIPYFRSNIIRELTVQWKSYGALVGSWNMLVYGTAFYVMTKIKGDESAAKSKLAFLMYILGLVNLMFGWAHHIYNVPTAKWIRYFAYAISMTELIILAKIIYNWKKSLTDFTKNYFMSSYKFLIASDVWILLNLTLALLISVPAINLFTHGTHITVAHAMGSTIGINTMILLASCYFIINHYTQKKFLEKEQELINAGYWIANVSLFVFWVCLILAGYFKGKYMLIDKLDFRESMLKIHSYLLIFSISGIGIFVGILMIFVPGLKAVWNFIKKGN